jgi:hypothetical protein
MGSGCPEAPEASAVSALSKYCASLASLVWYAPAMDPEYIFLPRTMRMPRRTRNTTRMITETGGGGCVSGDVVDLAVKVWLV